ncbi:MAG: TetR/AcrR family transcriptional regulator [Actinomycetales bacterium]|nr:TetR/AcrR family transcriptional regulator [Actinomycetales bacterium]
MPKINTEKLAQHREWRRQQLIDAAAAIALESGGAAVTVASVAERAGLSRTSVYEYFASSAELTADLVIDELNGFVSALTDAIKNPENPELAIEQWITAALRYIADGRHLLAKALSATDTPKDRAAEIGAAHRALLAPLRNSLTSMKIKDISQAMALLQGATDVATKRIEGGADANLEIATTTAFCIAGLKGLI